MRNSKVPVGLVLGLAAIFCTALRGRTCCPVHPALARHQRRKVAVALAGTAVADPPGDDLGSQALDADGERRYNPWDGRIYTFSELRKWGERVSWSEEELQDHWQKRCTLPVATTAASAAKGAATVATAGTADIAAVVAPQVEAWRRVWTLGPLSRMWTKADVAHLHAISGAAYTVAGAAYLLDTLAHDVAMLSGATWDQHIPLEAALASLLLGTLNAATGLQPALLAASLDDVPQALGFGPKANLKSAGFLNSSIFFFILAYQSLRALPGFPLVLAPLDMVFGLGALLATAHTIATLNGWVAKGLGAAALGSVRTLA